MTVSFDSFGGLFVWKKYEQVAQYTTLVVVTGLTTVQGQLVMVKVVDYLDCQS
jgi:hypothetical protein